MQIIPDASIAGLEITNKAAAGLRDIGDKIQNWKHMKRLDTLMAAREYGDLSSQMGNRIAQRQALAAMGGVIGLDNKQLSQLQIQDPYVSGIRGLGVENNNPELEIAMANGLVSKDTPYQITGSESDRNAEIWNRGYTAMMDAYKKGDMAKAMELAIQTDRDQSLNAQQFNKDIKGPGLFDLLKGLNVKGGGSGGKKDQMYGYDTRAKTWVPISMSRDIYENEKKRNAHLAKNYPSVDPNKLQYGGEDAASKLVAKNDTAKAEYIKAMDNAGAFIESITGIGSDIKRHMPFTDTLTDQINNWNMKNSAGPIRIVQNEDGQIVAVPNNSYVFNDYLDVDKKGLVVSNEWRKNSSAKKQSSVATKQAPSQEMTRSQREPSRLEKAMGEIGYSAPSKVATETRRVYPPSKNLDLSYYSKFETGKYSAPSKEERIASRKKEKELEDAKSVWRMIGYNVDDPRVLKNLIEMNKSEIASGKPEKRK